MADPNSKQGIYRKPGLCAGSVLEISFVSTPGKPFTTTELVL